MDLASGIAGLTSLTLELTTITYHYIRDVRNAPEESEQFHEELNALRTNLEELQKFLAAQDAQQMPFTKTSALVVSTNVCKNDLNYLKGKLVDFKRLCEKRKWYRKLAWPFQREEHAQVLRRIKDYTQTFHFSVSLEGCSLLAKTSKEIDEIHKQQRDSSRDVSEISTIIARLDTTIKCSIDHHFQEIRKSFENGEQKKLLDWLSKVDPSRNHNAAIEIKEPKTGEWFINSETFSQWVESAGLIWLYGIPGCGKTVLCSSIVECIQQLCRRASTKCKSAYFYFNFQAVTEQNLNLVLGSLLRQLSANEARVPSAIQELYDTHYAIGYSPSTKDLKDALIRTIEELGKEVYIMLDALDEVLDKKERSKILEHFATLPSSRLRNLHLLVTSRDEWDIRNRLESLSQGGTPIQRHEVDADIRKYVGSCLGDLEEVPQETKSLIQDKVGAGAHGIVLDLANIYSPTMTIKRFRWAACQVKTIQDCRTVAEIERALDDLPETLDETYERILQTIWRKDAGKARAIFTWLLFSERPLTLQEMAEAAVVRPGDMEIEHRDRLIHLSAVLSICRSLITLSDKRYYYSDLMKGIYEGGLVQLVYFAHFSVKEYLISGRSKVFTGLPSPSHEYIGHCCMSMLLPIDHGGLQLPHHVELPHGMLEKLMRGQHLLFYAITSWVFHIKQLESHKTVPGKLSHDVGKLLDRGSDTENYHIWMRLYNETRCRLSAAFLSALGKYGEERLPLFQPPLFYACRLGLVGETYRCIEAGSDVNQYVPGLGTPLHVALKRKSPKITEILLHCGADTKTTDSEDRTAFGAAAAYGHEENRRLLFDHGIDVNRELEDAIRNHEVATVCFLLDHGANGNHTLQSTARRQHSDIVQLGDGKSADFNADSYARLLIAAARAGDAKIFNLLLERGASIRATGRDGLDLLLAAVHGGSLWIPVIARLVKSCVDINAPAGIKINVWRSRPRRFYTTPLQYAVYTSDHDVVKYLLNNGAEVNRPDFSLGTELQAAIRSRADRGCRPLNPVEKVLRLLIDHDVDVNQQVQTRSPEIPYSPPSRKKGTALQQAAAEGLDYVAQFLVKEGADINAQHNHCGTALMCASRHSRPRTLQVLVEMKADINARVAGLGSALTEAARWGRHKNVQCLIENGADVDAEVDGVGTALLTALQYGQSKTAVVLIEAGADLYAAVRDMSSAFSIASEHEPGEIIKLCFSSYHPYPKASDEKGRRNQRGRNQRERRFGKREILRSCI